MQPWTGALAQAPAWQTSVEQTSPSLQSAPVVQGVQLGIATLPQTPPLQVSVVQALPSLQSDGVLQD